MNTDSSAETPASLVTPTDSPVSSGEVTVPTVPIETLTPRQIVAELDKFIVGQHSAKRAVAIALRNRFRRARLGEEMRDEVIPKNILMIGPTGVGKTEIARRLAKLARAPFLKVEATKFTEVGYVGRDVDSMVRDLVQTSVRLVEAERMEEVQEEADRMAVEQIVDILQPRRSKKRPGTGQKADDGNNDNDEDGIELPPHVAEFQRQLGQIFGGVATIAVATPFKQGNNNTNSGPSLGSGWVNNAGRSDEDDAEEPENEYDLKRAEQEERIRQRLQEQVKSGGRDDEEIEIEVEEARPPTILNFLGGPGMDDAMGEMQGVLGQLVARRKKRRRVPIREARKILREEMAQGLIDMENVTRDAVERAEQSGIIFIDEIDKVAGKSSDGGSVPDVSRGGVQRDLLPIIEGSTVQTRYGPVRTNYMLFIAAGAFHTSKPSDLIPELQGRLPIRVELESLNEADFRRILTEPRNSLTKQYTALLASDGVTITFADDAIHALARIAVDVNNRTENIGARRLHTVMERLLDELSFEAPEVETKTVAINAVYVHARLDAIVQDEDTSRYIL